MQGRCVAVNAKNVLVGLQRLSNSNPERRLSNTKQKKRCQICTFVTVRFIKNLNTNEHCYVSQLSSLIEKMRNKDF